MDQIVDTFLDQMVDTLFTKSWTQFWTKSWTHFWGKPWTYFFTIWWAHFLKKWWAYFSTKSWTHFWLIWWPHFWSIWCHTFRGFGVLRFGNWGARAPEFPQNVGNHTPGPRPPKFRCGFFCGFFIPPSRWVRFSTVHVAFCDPPHHTLSLKIEITVSWFSNPFSFGFPSPLALGSYGQNNRLSGTKIA